MAGEFHYRDPVIFDLETNGNGAIIQIGAIAPLSNDRFEVKVKFREDEANPKVLKLNHYCRDTWSAHAVSKKKARKRFTKFLEEHSSLSRVTEQTRNRYRVACGMGYNAYHFDMPLLTRWYGEEFLPIDRRVLDVFHLAMWLRPNLPSYTLSSVAEALGVEREDAHEAITDCEMTADVAAILLNEIGEFHNKWVGRRVRQIKRREIPF